MTPPSLRLSPLAWLALLALIAAALRVLQPFMTGMLWATMVVVVSWQPMLWLQARLRGRRWLAASAMTIGLLLLFVAPLALAIAAAVANAGEVAQRAHQLVNAPLPALPAWIAGLPLVGAQIQAFWNELGDTGLGLVWARLQPYAGTVGGRLLAEVGDAGTMLVNVGLTLAFCILLYLEGEAAESTLRRIAERLAGRHGLAAVDLTTQAIRGVALGVGGTAVVQSLAAGIALAVAGVPFAFLLGLTAFVLCIVQLGTPFVLLPAALWLFWQDAPGSAIFLLVCAVVIGALDNVLRPLLIQRGVDLPFHLVFMGVIGGLLGFGLVGIFVGPVVLAVVRMLLREWIGPRRPDEAARPDPL